jgi:hypothetical protein
MTDKKLNKLEQESLITVHKNDNNAYLLLKEYKRLSFKIKNESQILGHSVQLITKLISVSGKVYIEPISFLNFKPNDNNIKYIDIVNFDWLEIKLEETSNIESVELEIKYLIN